MKALEIVLAVLLSLVSLALIAIVTLQSGKEAGLSGALSGGSNCPSPRPGTGISCWLL